MATFTIECEQSLGYSHFGGDVTTHGESTVELTDEEVKTLVDLIREKNTTDVDKLELMEKHPDLYRKLDDAYRSMARRTEELYWLWDGYDNGYYEYDTEDLMDYCERECGYEYHPSDNVITDEEDEDYDEEALEEDKIETFSDWLYDYLSGLSDVDAIDFFYNHMDAEVDLDDVEYKVCIPADIIKMATAS